MKIKGILLVVCAGILLGIGILIGRYVNLEQKTSNNMGDSTNTKLVSKEDNECNSKSIQGVEKNKSEVPQDKLELEYK